MSGIFEKFLEEQLPFKTYRQAEMAHALYLRDRKYTYQEIAKRLGVAVSTARQLVIVGQAIGWRDPT